jgi:hypothetical protein
VHSRLESRLLVGDVPRWLDGGRVRAALPRCRSPCARRPRRGPGQSRDQGHRPAELHPRRRATGPRSTGSAPPRAAPQGVERASRVPARAASRCRSPLTSRCPVGQERRRERGGEHRWNGRGGRGDGAHADDSGQPGRAGGRPHPCAGIRPTDVPRSAGDGKDGAAVEVDGEHARQAQQPRLQQLGAVGVGQGVDAQAPAPGASLLGLEAGE